MRNIVIEELKASEVYRQRVEVVERKGLGHPDYICDSIMEQVSVRLSAEYLKNFGAILHHNIDKGLLVAGEVEGKFGGGKVISPMRLIFGDRATFEAGGWKSMCLALLWIRQSNGFPEISASWTLKASFTRWN